MPMVQIRIVRMRVRHRLVTVPVCVRRRIGHRRVIRTVRVPVVLVMHVRVRVFHRPMVMLVLMPFRQMEPDAERHERGTG